MPQAFEQLLQNPCIWRVGQVAAAARTGIGSGFAQLDKELPEGGWPAGALTELLCDDQGIGEISLLSPALRRLTHEGRGIALIAPAHLPFSRAWEARGIKLEYLLIVEAQGGDLQWSAEQALRSGSCGMVVVWGQGVPFDYGALRRLQLAAETGGTACVLYRALRAGASPSAAPLRIALASGAGELLATIIKRRGATKSDAIRLGVFPAHWNQQPSRKNPPPESHATASPAPAARVPRLLRSVSN